MVGYFEVLGGYSIIKGGDPLLGSAASGMLAYGGSFNGAIAIDITTSKRKTSTKNLKFHLGVQHRLAKGWAGTESYGLQATYPFARLESFNIYVSLGATPIVFSSVAGGSYGLQTKTYGAMAEVGYDYVITPEASFIASLGSQIIRAPSGYGPMPTFELTVGMKFTYGGPPNFVKNDRDYGDYEGERYPFGWEKKR